MIRQHTRRFWLLLYAVATALILSGCSGGSSSPASSTTTEPDTVSGTAAAGAPIVGFVGARDASGETKTVNLGADGSFELDVSGLTPPVLMYASGISGGNAYQLLSVAFADDVNGTVNITPLTDLIVGNTVGRNPQDFFNNPDFTQISQTAVEEQETALKTRLKPLLDGLGIAEDFDLRNTPFKADRTGFDTALDVIEVSVDTGTNTATITNRVDPTKSITNDFVAPGNELSEIEVDETTLTSGVTTLQAVNTLISTVANALENNDRATLEPLLTADFLNNGETATEWLDRLLGTEDADELAADIRSWSLASQEAGLANINIGSPNGTWKVVEDGGIRKLAGNQLQFFATVEATHVVQNGAQPPAVQEIGVSLFADNQVAALGTIGTSTVSVTGPQGTPFNTDLTAQTDFFGTFFALDSANLGQIQTGDQYTFTWSNTNGASASAPYRVRRGSPQLTEGAPLITSSTADLAADQYTFEWTLPPGYESVSVRSNFTGQETGNELDSGDRTFTGNLPAGFVPQAGNELRLIARDPFGVFVAARLENPFADQIPPAMAEDALIGSWILRNTGRPDDAPYVHISFLESGYYMHQELDVPYRPAAEDAGNTGIEFGRYEWDNETGELTVPEIIIDDNRFWGLTDVENGENRLALRVDGDTLTASNPEFESAETIEFTRVPLNETGITGSWLVQNPSDPTDVVVATLLEDGFYFVGSTTPAEPEFGTAVGLEFGTYTYNSETLVLNASPIFDQNGTAGLSDPRPQSFYYSTVVDGSLIFDEGEGAVAQLSELAPGVTPSDGTVTVNYVRPDDGSSGGTTAGPAVSGDFHYLRSAVGIESSRLNNPPSVFQVHFAHKGANIVDNTDGTGTLSWTDLCIGDLLIDSGASEDGRDAVFDSVSECLGISSSFDLSFTDTGLFAAVPESTIIDPEDGSQIINGATEIDFRALDAGRSLFIANEANTFQYEEGDGSFTDGRDMNTHVLSKKDPALTADALAGDWGFVTLRINQTTDPNDDTVLEPNFMDYGAGAINFTVDATGNATVTDEIQLLLLQGLKPLQNEGVSIDPIMEENGLNDNVGAFSVAADGTLSLLNGEIGGFASQGADVMTLARPNPFTPYTVQTKESSLLTGVKLDPNFQAADLANKSYDVILKGYFAGQNYFETDIWLPGATLDFDASGGATSQRGLTFAFSNFGLNTDVFDTTRQSANLDPNSWTYQVDASTGLIRMESPQYTYSSGTVAYGEQVGYSSADNRLLVLVSRFYDNSGGTPTGPGGTYIAYAICNNCN